MLRYLGILALSLTFILELHSQEVIGFHDVKAGLAPNEYLIKTTVKGLKGVDIARIKYIIDSKHTYKPSPNNALFSDRNEEYVKFYIMAVPVSGELTIELGVLVADESEYAFPVEFQYSKNEVKKEMNLPQINISGGEVIALVETPEPIAPEVEEIPEPIAPAVEEMPETTPEEDPEEEETPEPVAPAEEEIPEPIAPAVEEVPETTPEENPEEEETPEPVAPAEEEIPEPIAPAVEEVPETTPEENPEEEETPEPVAPSEEEIPEVDDAPTSLTRVVKDKPELEDTPTEIAKTGTKYTVQLLSLSKFSQTRLNAFCKQHKLAVNDVKKRQVGGWMKITYGEANSIQDAILIKEKLMRDNNITECFVTPLN